MRAPRGERGFAVRRILLAKPQAANSRSIHAAIPSIPSGTMPHARLILFTGLGVSRHLLDRQGNLPLDLELPPWIDPLPDEPLAAYARRMAANIVSGESLFVGGVSFGGMVALEVARHVPVAGVFLLSGALSGAAVSPVLRPLARFAPSIPLVLGQPILATSPLLYPLLGVSRRDDRRALDQVLPYASPPLFRWGARAAVTWRPAGHPAVPVHHIHGGSDLIIPVRRVRPDVIVEGAGHLLNLTHADVVNAFILERIRRTLQQRKEE